MYLLEQGTAERLTPWPGHPPRVLTMWSPRAASQQPRRVSRGLLGRRGGGRCAPAAGDAIGRRRGAARQARPWLAAAGPQWRRGPPRAPPLRRGGVPCAGRSPPEGAQPSPWLPRRRLGPAPRWPRARRGTTSTGCAPSSPEVGAPGGPCPVSAGPAWGERGAGARGGCGGQAESLPCLSPAKGLFGGVATRGSGHSLPFLPLYSPDVPMPVTQDTRVSRTCGRTGQQPRVVADCMFAEPGASLGFWGIRVSALPRRLRWCGGGAAE